MAQARRRKAGNQKPRERILTAARDLFRRRGVHDVGVDEIASAANSNKMTLYRHFGSKEKLTSSCLHMVMEEVDAKWREIEARSPQDGARKLADWISHTASGFAVSDGRSELILTIFRQAREDPAARMVLDDFTARRKKWLAEICRSAGVANAGMLSEALALLAHGVRANPWGLSNEALSTQYSALADMLVDLFRSSQVKAKRGASRRKGAEVPSEDMGSCGLRPRERILMAAVILFHKHGVQGANVDEIASAAGSNKMTLYRHFGSKKDLARACLQAAVDEIAAIWRGIETRNPDDATRRLEDWIDYIAGAIAGTDRRSEMTSLTFRLMQGESSTREMIADFKAKARKWVAQTCRATGVAEPEMLSDTLILLMHGVRTNPWGMSRESLGDQFFSIASVLVKLFKSRRPVAAVLASPAREGRSKGGKGVVRSKRKK